jgi:integrase
MAKKQQSKNFLGFRPAHLKMLPSRTVVEYFVTNPNTQQLERKHIRLDHLPVAERKRYGKRLAESINDKLYDGWNPWLDEESPHGFKPLLICLDEYIKSREREDLRGNSLRSFRSMVTLMAKWMHESGNVKVYVNAFTSDLAIEIMNWFWLGRNVSARTYNNYLEFYISLFSWFIQYRYCKVNPFLAIAKKKVTRNKKRVAIPAEDRKRIAAYWQKENPYYLVACFLAYGCQVRRLEACRLRVRAIQWANGTLIVEADEAKNGKARTVTMPRYVVDLLLDLEIHKAPANWYLISYGFKPGKKQLPEKHISDAWVNMRKALRMPDTYQFYSLRDTGITQMLNDGIPAHMVRDQADHSSLSITDIYARNAPNQVNALIRDKTTPF